MSEITRRGFVKGAALVAPLAFTPFTVAQTSSAPRYDVVIVGAGHNSLITACYLAKAGFKCVVLEGRPKIAIRRALPPACKDFGTSMEATLSKKG